ncbi:MAG: hypothetical protein QXQ70_09535 [Candidatus Caldarchaeum sp.]
MASTPPHKGGVHVDAVVKSPRTYEHVDQSLPGVDRALSVSEPAGRRRPPHHPVEISIQATTSDTLLPSCR